MTANPDPSQMKLPEKKSQLSMESTIKLADWLRKQELTDTSASRLAAAAAAALRLRITANNVQSVLDAAGLRITASASLEERNAAKLDAIAESVAAMCDWFDPPAPVPQALLDAFGAEFVNRARGLI